MTKPVQIQRFTEQFGRQPEVGYLGMGNSDDGEYVRYADHHAALLQVRERLEALAQKWHGETVVATTAFYNAATLDKCCHESCCKELLALAATLGNQGK